MYLRILYKSHVFGFMSQHLCISWILCKIHVSGFMSQHLYISGSSARSMSPDPCVRSMASTNMDPLQDPCLRIHVSASLYLRFLYKIHVFGFMSQHPLIWILYKIHVFGFMSQHLCISGTSARSMSPDPYISIHMYLRILCKIHVSGCSRMYLRNLYKIHVFGFMSQHLCISRILCKIHVSGFMSQHPFIPQDPLQDPCLRIHVSASLHLRILYKIHVFGFMSQHLRISGSSARSMCPIHVLASTKMDPLEDPHLRIHVSASLYLMNSLQDPCLWNHVSASMCISGSSARSMLPDP